MHDVECSCSQLSNPLSRESACSLEHGFGQRLEPEETVAQIILKKALRAFCKRVRDFLPEDPQPERIDGFEFTER